MKKVITAINNPKLNEELKKEKKFEIIGKDIQYKEAIIEILEKNKNINLIIISEKILGQIGIEKLIKKIKLINEEIKIIFILEKENNELEKILIKNKIIDIYYNNKINLNELIKIINKKEINMEEEIIKLKKIIEEKDNNLNKKSYLKKMKKSINNKKRNFIKEKLDHITLKKIINEIEEKSKKIIRKKTKIREEEIEFIKNMSTKIITFSGNYKSGKTTLALIISQYLSNDNNKVLLIDGDLEKQDLSIILNKKANIKPKRKNNKKVNKNKSNFSNKFFNKKEIQKNYLTRKKYNKRKIKNGFNKNIINKKKIKLFSRKNTILKKIIKKIINLYKIKINKNLYFLKVINYLLKTIDYNKEKYIVRIIKNFLNQLKKDYDFIIIDLSKTNPNIINKEILKNSDINFIVMEANLLGLKEIKTLLNIYINKWKINKNTLNILINKNNFNSINKKLISNFIPIKNKIYKINKNKFFNVFKTKYLLKNKKIYKEIKKIIKIINKI